MSLTISLTADQVEARLARLGLPCRFTQDEREHACTTPIVSPGTGFFWFPTPTDNSALTLRIIKDKVGTDPKRQPSFFDHPWYANEAFMDRPCPPGWHSLCMDVLPASVGQPFDYLSSLGSRHLELPAAVEVVLMLFLHFVDSGEQLLFRKHTWCGDQTSLGQFVTVGAFGRNGVFVSAHPRGYFSRGLGICAKVTTTPSKPCG